jgi:hypothetical protein
MVTVLPPLTLDHSITSKKVENLRDSIQIKTYAFEAVECSEL